MAGGQRHLLCANGGGNGGQVTGGGVAADKSYESIELPDNDRHDDRHDGSTLLVALLVRRLGHAPARDVKQAGRVLRQLQQPRSSARNVRRTC
jgi:hypothetical protein